MRDSGAYGVVYQACSRQPECAEKQWHSASLPKVCVQDYTIILEGKERSASLAKELDHKSPHIDDKWAAEFGAPLDEEAHFDQSVSAMSRSFFSDCQPNTY